MGAGQGDGPVLFYCIGKLQSNFLCNKKALRAGCAPRGKEDNSFANEDINFALYKFFIFLDYIQKEIMISLYCVYNICKIQDIVAETLTCANSVLTC
jgi:hypothetical protein